MKKISRHILFNSKRRFFRILIYEFNMEIKTLLTTSNNFTLVNLVISMIRQSLNPLSKPWYPLSLGPRNFGVYTVFILSFVYQKLKFIS